MTEQDDITEEELQAIQKEVDEDIAKNGLPTDEQLHAMVDEMNATAPAE